MSSWRYVLADLGGNSLGELRAHDRTFNPGVSTTATASGRIRQDDSLWSSLAAGQSNLKVYDSGGNLRLYGPVVSDEDQAQGNGSSVAFTAADQSFELSKRYFAKDATGVGHGYNATTTDAIVSDFVGLINAERATGITIGTTGTFVTQSAIYLYKRALDAIAELGAVAGSYEWGLRFVDGAPPSCLLDLVARIGTDRSSTVFLEYGTGKRNCQSYSRVRSLDQQATRILALGGGSTLASEAFDSGAETTYAARREDVVTAGDIYVHALLDSFAAAQVSARKDPQQVVTLTPVPGTLRYGTDYVVGDTVSARVVINGVTRVATTARIYSAQVAIDDLGNEVPALALLVTS